MATWRTLAKAGVSIMACAILLNTITLSEVADKLSTANPYWLLAVFAIIHLDRAFMVYKWRLLLSGLGVLMSTGTLLRAYYVASFWATFLPMTVGGDIVRAGWLMRNALDGPKIISSIVVERLLGALALAVAAVGSLVFVIVYLGLSLRVLSSVIFFLLLVSVVAVTILFSRSAHDIVQNLMFRLRFQKASGIIAKISVATSAFKKKPGLLVGFLMLSIVEQGFPIIATFILAKAFTIELTMTWAIIGVPLILAVSRMPISVNSLGITEGIYAFVFSFAGIPVSESVSISVMGRVLLLLAMLPGALWTSCVSENNVPLPVATQGSGPMEGK